MRRNLSRIVHSLYKTKKYTRGAMPTLYSAETRYPKNKKMLHTNYCKITLGAATCSFVWLCAEMLKDDEIGAIRPDLPFYSREEVAKHNSKKISVWVTYRQGVYDITDYIDTHPGGEIIFKAAGCAIDHFWKIHKSHNQDYVKELLESYRIGNLDEKGKSKNVSYDPRRNPNDRPTPLGVVASTAVGKKKPDNPESPKILFFKENPAHPPSVNPATYKLVVVQGKESKSFSLQELKELPRTTVNATILCAAKKSKDQPLLEPARGMCWAEAVLGQAQWSGVKLSTVLKTAGVITESDNLSYVKFESLGGIVTSRKYLSTIPLPDALDENGDVLLAYEMNGEKLTSKDGFPLRVIIPKIDGAKNVKWINRIVVIEDIEKVQNENEGTLCPESGLVIFNKSTEGDKSLKPVCLPSDGDTVVVNDDNTVSLKGYAWSAAEEIVRVDVSYDKGATWHRAIVTPEETSKNTEKKTDEKSGKTKEYATWDTWEARLPLPEAGLFQTEIWVKAVDSSYTEPLKTLSEVLYDAYENTKLILKLF